MANQVAPGVYTSIIPLEQYTATVTGTNGFIAFFSDRGPDNQLYYLGEGSPSITNVIQSQSFTQVYGQPNLSKYTSSYGQGGYVGYAYSSVVSSIYALRVLPPDATYSNIAFCFAKTTENQLVTIQTTIPNLTNLTELNSDFFSASPSTFGLNSTNFDYFYPLFVITSAYRGEYYNNFQVQVEPVVNNNQLFNFSVYENVQQNWVMKSSYNVSFNPNLLDNSGMSTMISSVVSQFDNNVRVSLIEDNPIYNTQTNEITAATVTANTNFIVGDIVTNASSLFNVIVVEDVIDNILDVPSTNQSGNYAYFIENTAGGPLFGYAGEVVTITTTYQNGQPVYTINPIVLKGSNGTMGTAGEVYTAAGIATTVQVPVGTIIVTSKQDVYFSLGSGELQAFDPYTYSLMISGTYSANGPLNLSNGSDGSLIDPTTGIINSSVASSLLESAYLGNIDPNVLNTDFYPFDLVFDAGYPLSVKQSIVTLTSQLRMDCLALLDLGQNASSNNAITNRIQNENFNTFYAALYDPYIQIADQFTGKNIWVTPIYIVSQLYAANDSINPVWYAVAGYNRGAVNNILGLMYQPDLTSYYENQINPIVTTSAGNVIWGQLTTQRAQNSMQNVNVVRLVLYISRAIKNLGKYYIFDMNDAITWTNIQTSINNFLSQVQSERGLYDFSVSISATQYQLNNKQVTVSVTLTPTLALEQILVPIYVQ